MIKNKQKRNKNFFKTFFSFFVCVWFMTPESAWGIRGS
jgi:hypothetical protein